MGRPRVVNNLPQFTLRARDDGARGRTQALLLGASEASVMTPIDTSNLINSQFQNVRIEGDKVIGTVGYTAAYALPVHDPGAPHPATLTALRLLRILCSRRPTARPSA